MSSSSTLVPSERQTRTDLRVSEEEVHKVTVKKFSVEEMDENKAKSKNNNISFRLLTYSINTHSSNITTPSIFDFFIIDIDLFALPFVIL